jgi:hypothetical protein
MISPLSLISEASKSCQGELPGKRAFKSIRDYFVAQVLSSLNSCAHFGIGTDHQEPIRSRRVRWAYGTRGAHT